ncbi:Predicted dehydrogenase [Mariniphaga anaerophila]|uniref:Predicted dehydrogenase n=1 Tax=Mariniphaga anaerophila TaxID=1484053 RepID=A0A1M4T531_9BACT|nr:Gfo/Idh/MocA family oxidoreductase [Mariniphaga anaerophila]SHE39653.1 Predicted dehydrogenase [Mariniphaga anaerophila]
MNIVVVGFGFMGMTHAGNILKNPHLNLAAIVDKNPDIIFSNLKKQSGNFSTGSISEEQLSRIKIYSDFEECLKTENPDACIIAVHTNLHFPLAKLALNFGAHVFVEKPFCLDVAEGDELIKLARSKKRILMVGQVVRFMQAYQTLKNWIDTNEFGELEFLSLSRFSGVPSWGQWKERQKNFGSSGGALFDLVIHDIDFAQSVCGIPDEIAADCLPGQLSNHDYVSGTWKYNGKKLRVRVEGGNIFHAGFPFQAGFSARFQKASISYSPKDPENIIVATDTETSLVPAGDANDGFSDELNYFVACANENKWPDKCTPESALDSIKICYRHTDKF